MTHLAFFARASGRLLAGIGFAAVVAVGTAQAQPLAAHDSSFYLSVNLDTMRDGAASKPLYRWFQQEVLDDVREELGVDLIDALNGVSIFGTGANQVPVLVLHGDIPRSARDHVVDTVFSEKGKVELKTAHGRNYYEFAELDLDWDGVENRFGQDHDALLIAFGDRGQSMVTPDPEIMDRFLRDGALAVSEMSSELMVLEAERPLARGGVNNRKGSPRGGPWESRMFRQVERFGLVISDEDDAVSLTLEAESATPELAEAMANLVRGLVSLKVLSQDTDPDLEWLGALEITTRDRITRMQARVPAESLVSILD